MKRSQPELQTLIFEIRYASGHLYFDRCGQTLLDVEREHEGWLAGIPDAGSGSLERPDKKFRIIFNNTTFNFNVQRAYKNDITAIAKEVSAIWKIIQANLGLDEFLRLGCRLNYLLSTESIDEAEQRLKKSELDILIPNNLTNSGYNVKTRHVITVLSREDMEYRIDLGTITRTEGVDPSHLVKGETRALSKKQREVRIEQLKRLREYSVDPMYAVQIDVDCVQYQPETVSVEEYIIEQARIVENDFLPILEKL